MDVLNGVDQSSIAVAMLVPMLLAGVISVGCLVWYLWAMARLFPKIGLSASAGWIPIWNQWKLMDRAGMPGWTILLGFVPFLGIIPLIVLIIAMHRINKQANASGGYTVLGILLPPLWATMLANFIGNRIVADGALAYAPAPAASLPAPSTQPWSAPAPPTQVPTFAAASSPTPPPLLGGDTEAEYARLAAQGFHAPPPAPLVQQAPEPFSWSGALREQSESEPVSQPLLPPVHPFAVGQHEQAPSSPAVDEAPTVAVVREIEDSLDERTIVVQRGARPTWMLELPDGTEIALEHDSIVGRKPEGRDDAVAITIPDATRTLSKSHARFTFDGERWTVEDLGSTNGLVLLHADGREQELAAGERAEATERMLIGTLEVLLKLGGSAA